MAKIEASTVKIELTYAEFLAVQEALKVADKYEFNELWSSILNDMSRGE